MASRLNSMQAQFRQKQQDDKEHKLEQQGHGSRLPAASGMTRSTATAGTTHRNGFLPQNKTAPLAQNSRSGVGTGIGGTSRPVPSALRPATTATAVATKPNTILHKITLTGTNSSARAPSATSTNSAFSNGSGSGASSPRVGLDRSATYSKPSVLGSSSRGLMSQSQNRRCDENGNELMSVASTAPSRARVGGGGVSAKPYGTGTGTRTTGTPRLTTTADLTKRLEGLNFGERKAPAAASRPTTTTAATRTTANLARSAPPPRNAPTTSAVNVTRKPLSSVVRAAPAARPASTTAPKVRPTASSTALASRNRQPPGTKKATPPPGSVSCSQCGRHFASDRIEKHETICKKTAAKKRKVFDPTKMRMKGTEAEPYLKVVVASTRTAAKTGSSGAGAAAAAKSNWRKKHEDFIRTIRLAREYNAHVAAGGNPADLPPPPASDYSDYVQCPHCGRKFSQDVAERHVPRCANIKSNKR